jgi:hypothetical protein
MYAYTSTYTFTFSICVCAHACVRVCVCMDVKVIHRMLCTIILCIGRRCYVFIRTYAHTQACAHVHKHTRTQASTRRWCYRPHGRAASNTDRARNRAALPRCCIACDGRNSTHRIQRRRSRCVPRADVHVEHRRTVERLRAAPHAAHADGEWPRKFIVDTKLHWVEMCVCACVRACVCVCVCFCV